MVLNATPCTKCVKLTAGRYADRLQVRLTRMNGCNLPEDSSFEVRSIRVRETVPVERMGLLNTLTATSTKNNHVLEFNATACSCGGAVGREQFSQLVQRVFNESVVLAAEVNYTTSRSTKYKAELLPVGCAEALLRITGLPEEFVRPRRVPPAEANTLKRKVSLPKYLPQPVRGRESLLSQLRPLDLSSLAPPEDSSETRSVPGSCNTSPAVSGSVTSVDSASARQGASDNFFYLSPSNLTYPATSMPEEESRTVFADLKEETFEGARGAGVAHNKTQGTVQLGAGGGLFDQVMFGALVDPAHRAILKARAEEAAAAPVVVPTCTVSKLSPETVSFLTEALEGLPVGVRTAISGCLLEQDQSPCGKALFIAKKILSLLEKTLSAKGVKLGVGTKVKIPCFSALVGFFKRVVGYYGDKADRLVFSITSSCVLCLVLLLDVHLLLGRHGYTVDAKHVEGTREILAVVLDRLLVTASSPLLSPAQTHWLFNASESGASTSKATDDVITPRQFLRLIEDKYRPCPSQLFATLTAECPLSDSEKESEDAEEEQSFSPVAKRQKHDSAAHGNKVDAAAGPRDAQSVLAESKAVLQEFLKAPKVVVTSRTDEKGILGLRMVRAPPPLQQQPVVVAKTTRTFNRLSSELSACILSPVRGANPNVIVPCTPGMELEKENSP